MYASGEMELLSFGGVVGSLHYSNLSNILIKTNINVSIKGLLVANLQSLFFGGIAGQVFSSVV